jgi:UDP-N-acetylmuramoyl-L-alanyl-D-glutamate--2,6-diaminopimelate ligase
MSVRSNPSMATPAALLDDRDSTTMTTKSDGTDASMTCVEVADMIGLDRRAVIGDIDGVEITSVSMDSRDVRAGALFCCVQGERFDGHAFATTAIEQGAVALLVEHALDEVPRTVPQFVVGNARALVGPIASRLVGDPSRELAVVGITGTNGKTTTAHLLASILRAAGRTTDIIGTLHGRYTTPEAPNLQSALADMRTRGVQAVAMEVSSHALAFERVGGMHFAASVFTNLSRDHLDFHGTMEAYFAAKARLFQPELSALGVVNADDAYGQRLLAAPAIPMTSFRRDDARNVDVSVFAHEYDWDGLRLHVDIGGFLNVLNSLAAATVARELGIAGSDIESGLAAAGPVPGRFERIDEGQDFTVLVDYAHTPDGLSEVLRSVRSIPGIGRVIVVFGCGGDRDKMKRPMMGEVSVSLADLVIITSDNPRSEDPEAIMASIVAGIPDHMRHRLWDRRADRAQAIAQALGLARPGDVVLITGKGHETTQTVGAEVLPFDDRVVARDMLRSSR